MTLGHRIGQGIREQRRRARMAQMVLAERAGLSLDHVGLVERGERDLSIRALERVARALGVDPVELLRTGGSR